MKKTCFGVAGACLLLSSTAWAVTAQPDDADLQKIAQQTAKLEKQVQQLTAEVKTLKRQKRQQPTAKAVAVKGEAQPGTPPSDFQPYHYLIGRSVTTSPYLGLRSAFDASDLITNLPSMNEDLALLKQRRELQRRLKTYGLYPPYIDRPMIEFSGQLQGQGIMNFPYHGASSSDIDFTAAELDTLLDISDWALGFLSIQYDNSGDLAATPGNRISNSRFFLSRGFITLGNLDKTPIYFSLGQMYVPFGIYSNGLITAPITQALARTNQRAALLGFDRDGYYGSVYAFKGPTAVNNEHGINNGGVNFGYEYSGDKLSANVGAGVIANMADSDGMQDTGASLPSFPGFGNSSEILGRRVPGVNAHASATMGPYTLIGEVVSAIRSFDADNLSFNDSGARPGAFDLEGTYNFQLGSKPSNFVLAYDHSWEALGLNLPKHSLFAVFNISLWKDTAESIEFRHDINYSSSDSAGGNEATPVVQSEGSTANTITAQLTVYF